MKQKSKFCVSHVGAPAVLLLATHARVDLYVFSCGWSAGTLLATQQWVKSGDKDGGPVWKLRAHRTIPFSVNAGAMATLRCDKRGCVAGIRELDKQGPLDMPDPARP